MSAPAPSGATGFRSGANLALDELPDSVDHRAVDLVAGDGAVSRGLLYRPRGHRTRVGLHLMHPRTDQSRNYLVPALVEQGHTVLGRAGRWVNNDIATEHERLLPDVAAGITLLREQGCEQIILVGNSGGGSLAAFYQAQATRAPGHRLIDTAAGRPFDLNGFDLPAADGIALVGAHLGEGACLMKWLDPSVTDEDDPTSCDPTLDMYDPANGFVLPPAESRYAEEFLARFRAAQRDRAVGLDERARRLLAEVSDAAAAPGLDPLRRERLASRVPLMLTHRTMADPAFCDLSIDPDDRTVAAYNNHPRPDLVNWGVGVAVVLRPEAWLSTWSGLSSRAEMLANLPEVRVPVLVAHYAGDSITRLSEARAMVDHCGSDDVTFAMIRDADHYGYTIGPDGARGARTSAAIDALVDWLAARFVA